MDLEKARKELGMTQEEIALNVGVSHNSWWSYENGIREAPEKVLGGVRTLLNSKKEPKFELDLAKQKEGELIENYLLDALKMNGAHKPVFIDLVERYMEMWKTSILLERDIKERGVLIISPTGAQRKNDSIGLLVNMNRQMLTILDKLGLNASSIKQADGIDV